MVFRLHENSRMAKPDTPNFSIFGRIVFGFIAIALIIMLLHFFNMI